jgi:predicted dehydrogenase
VIGVGHLGKHHARLMADIAGARLVAVVDAQIDRATAAAEPAGARALTDYREIFDEVDAVTVAVPTELHHEIALPFLERGISVLVEKPMTRTLAEADELIAAASASGATLAGRPYRALQPGRRDRDAVVTTPRFIEVHRLGVFPDRSLDIDVVFDLMIHDLDIILALVKAEPTSIEAVGVPVLTDKVRHRKRAPAVFDRLHRERDRQPDQQGARPQDPFLPA